MLLTLWSGLVLGSVYALVAYGLMVSLLPSGVFNFAQGALVVVGCYVTYSALAEHHLGLVPLLAVNALVGAALGVLCEVVCVRPLRRGGVEGRSPSEIVTTVGLSTALIGALALHVGYQPRAVPFPGSTTPLHVLGVAARPDQVLVVGSALALAVVLHLALRHSRWGLVLLAVTEDRESAGLRGIDVERLSLLGFAAAGAFACLSAVAIGPLTYATPTLADTVALGAFAALAVSGHGSFPGALVGGLLVGTVAALATRYLGSSWSGPAVLLVLLVTLLARPDGLARVASVRRA